MEFKYYDNEDKPGVYKITCTANGKVYFGETVCFKRRWEHEHRLDLQNRTHWNKHLQSAFIKYGTESFIFEVLEVVLGDREERTSKETKYIQEYVESGNKEKLFNKRLTTVSAQGPWSLTPEETKKKMSAAQKGRKHSEDTRAKMSRVQKGRTFSEETRKKMSDSQKK